MSDCRILDGSVFDVLPTLEAESVQCVVTSPPYWGLRDYGEDGQIGLEATPEEYVEKMVAVFREVRQVLREDGTVWLNLGDSYAAARGGTHQPAESLAGGTGGVMPDGSRVNRSRRDGYSPSRNASAIGLKHKDLVGIPWRVAFALQADGWWLRSAIVWAKPNPMPESVTDRPTSSYEHVFLMARSERYFYDADAIREPQIKGASGSRFDIGKTGTRHGGDRTQEGYRDSAAGRNKRNVWTITTKPFPEAHFATFPEDLVVPCVKAGTSERGCCAECGAPMQRVSEVSYENPGNRSTNGPRSKDRRHETAGFDQRLERRTKTVGWEPACDCSAGTKPCVVLDPFAGAGTVGVVCSKHGRDFVGIELNPEYADMARRRIGDTPMSLFAAVNE